VVFLHLKVGNPVAHYGVGPIQPKLLASGRWTRVKNEYAGWSAILAECGRLFAATNDSDKTSHAAPHCGPPEAAFRITLREKSEGWTALESIVGGIPGIPLCVVRSVTPRASMRCLSADPNEQPVGVIMRRSRREDLHVFYRASDGGLVLYTLPEKSQSLVMLVPLKGDAAIRQAALGGHVCRVEFSALQPGSYLLLSFSLVDLDALQREAQLLREQGMHSDALSLITEILELDPEHFEAWTRKAYILREMACPEEAMAAVEEALKINQEFALAWRAKGALLRDGGKHQQGLDCYLQSLELDPTDHLCWENKGNALRALGRDAEAEEAYAKARQVKELHPDEKR
jgi:hypothetical protein